MTDRPKTPSAQVEKNQHSGDAYCMLCGQHLLHADHEVEGDYWCRHCGAMNFFARSFQPRACAIPQSLTAMPAIESSAHC